MAGECVLVVDDNPSNIELLEYVLSAKGYDVRTAQDGTTMFLALESFRPRIILMDIQLPGVDGIELTRQLKAAPATRGIPVLAVTAYAMRGDEQRMIDAGCVAHVGKPIDIRQLPMIVAGIIEAWPASDEGLLARNGKATDRQNPPST
jgi:CheY-like chemotaxis protein